MANVLARIGRGLTAGAAYAQPFLMEEKRAEIQRKRDMLLEKLRAEAAAVARGHERFMASENRAWQGTQSAVEGARATMAEDNRLKQADDHFNMQRTDRAKEFKATREDRNRMYALQERGVVIDEQRAEQERVLREAQAAAAQAQEQGRELSFQEVMGYYGDYVKSATPGAPVMPRDEFIKEIMGEAQKFSLYQQAENSSRQNGLALPPPQNQGYAAAMMGR